MGLFSKHVIEVETIFKTKDGKKLEESTRTLEQVDRSTQRLTSTQKKFDSTGKESVITTDRQRRGLQGFQMEQLGVMFAGMALNKAMSNLNATAREWVGINELMSTAMGLVLLPTTLDLLNFGILPLFDALTSLPEPAQKAIGGMTLALEGVGGVMMVGGQLALGVASLTVVLEKMGIAAGTTLGILTKLGGIGLLAIGLTFAIAGATTDDPGTFLLTTLAAVIATALGGIVLGASLTGGIIIGGIVVGAIVAFQLSTNLAERAKAFDEFGEDIPLSETPFISGAVRQRGSRQTTGPSLSQDLQDFEIDFSKILPEGAQPITINQKNTITGFDLSAVQKEIERNNAGLTRELGRIVNINK